MAFTNLLAKTKQIILPVWEWTRFAPAISTAISCTCAADNSNFNPNFGRYIYYMIAAAQFWRYDTWTDTYIQLSSPPIAPATWSSMRFAGAYGTEALAIAGGAATFTMPGYFGQAYKGYDVVIMSGTGMGQRRTIASVADAVQADTGVATGIANALGGITLTDSTKAWTINQYAGYQLRITFGAGVSQVRKILYNSATVLTLGDSVISGATSFSNPMIFSPAIAAGSIYAIESSVFTVSPAWTTQPDATSYMRISSGSVFLVSSAAATPFYTIQQYDIVADTWYIRTANTLNFATVGTDGALERTSENASMWDRGIANATASNTTTLSDPTKAWVVNQWVGYYVRIFAGTGNGQLKAITANTATTLTFSAGTAPDSTSNYLIEGFDAGTASSGTATTLVDSTKSWGTNRWANYAIRITGGTGQGQLLPIVSNNGTTLTVSRNWVTNPDNTSTYSIQGDPDKLYLTLGANASMLILNLNEDLGSFSRWYDGGLTGIATASVGGLRPIAIASATHSTTTATIVTAQTHYFRVGQSVTVRGFTDANYNTTASIATVVDGTHFTYTMAGTPAADTIVSALSTSVLVDASKTWTVNQWAGYMVYMNTTAVTAASGLATGQAIQIASNTASTLTFAAVSTAPVNGVSRYVICSRGAIGAADNGIATGAGQLTTALQDTGKAWVVNIWTGKKVRILGGTGQSQELTITSNTSNTLTFGAGTAPVAGASSYVLLDQPVRGTGIEISWVFGTSDANLRGKYLFCPRGGGVVGFDRYNLTTDRVELSPITPQLETLTTGTQCSYDGGDRIYFTKDITLRMYYLDVVLQTVHGAGQMPYTAGTTILGNRMEIFTTPDGVKFLWINRHSNTECFRQVLFW